MYICNIYLVSNPPAKSWKESSARWCCRRVRRLSWVLLPTDILAPHAIITVEPLFWVIWILTWRVEDSVAFVCLSYFRVCIVNLSNKRGRAVWLVVLTRLCPWLRNQVRRNSLQNSCTKERLILKDLLRPYGQVLAALLQWLKLGRSHPNTRPLSFSFSRRFGTLNLPRLGGGFRLFPKSSPRRSCGWDADEQPSLYVSKESCWRSVRKRWFSVSC